LRLLAHPWFVSAPLLVEGSGFLPRSGPAFCSLCKEYSDSRARARGLVRRLQSSRVNGGTGEREDL
jgi:hypothetical protein